VEGKGKLRGATATSVARWFGGQTAPDASAPQWCPETKERKDFMAIFRSARQPVIFGLKE